MLYFNQPVNDFGSITQFDFRFNQPVNDFAHNSFCIVDTFNQPINDFGKHHSILNVTISINLSMILAS